MFLLCFRFRNGSGSRKAKKLCFEELNVLSGWLEASPRAYKSFKEIYVTFKKILKCKHDTHFYVKISGIRSPISIDRSLVPGPYAAKWCGSDGIQIRRNDCFHIKNKGANETYKNSKGSSSDFKSLHTVHVKSTKYHSLQTAYQKQGTLHQSCESRRQTSSTCSRPRFREIWKSRRYRDRYRCQEKKSRRCRDRDLVFRDPPTPRMRARLLFVVRDSPPPALCSVPEFIEKMNWINCLNSFFLT